MAKKRQSRSDDSATKWKKKKWVELVAPEVFQQQTLGQTVLEDPTAVTGRVVSANVMNLTKDIKKQNLTMRFVVTDVKEGKGHTSPISLTMAPSAVKRLVRSSRDRIDDSFVVQTKDEVLVRVKPLIVTRDNKSIRQQSTIRKLAQNEFVVFASEHSYEDFVKAVLDDSLVKRVREVCKKIAPIRTLDIRAFRQVKSAADSAMGKTFSAE